MRKLFAKRNELAKGEMLLTLTLTSTLTLTLVLTVEPHDIVAEAVS